MSFASYAAGLACLAFWGYGLLLLYFELIDGRPMMQHATFAEPAQVLGFVVIAAALRPLFAALAGWHRHALVLAAAVLFMAPLATDAIHFWPSVVGQPLPADWWIKPIPEPLNGTALGGVSAVLLAAATLLLATAAIARRPAVAVAALAVLAMVNMEAGDRGVFRFEGRAEAREAYYTVAQVQAKLEAYNPSEAMRFWYNVNEPSGDIYRGVASMNLFRNRLLSDQFPDPGPIADSGVPRVQALETVAIFAATDPLKSANKALAPLELSTELITRFEAEDGERRFVVYVVRLVPRGLGPANDLVLRDLSPVAGSVRVDGKGRAVVETPPKPYNYSAAFNLPYPATTGAYVMIRARATGGTVGFGVESADRTKFVALAPLREDDGLKEIYLRVPDVAKAGMLIVLSWTEPRGAEATIEAITVFPILQDS
jgi:hypothetical protein